MTRPDPLAGQPQSFRFVAAALARLAATDPAPGAGGGSRRDADPFDLQAWPGLDWDDVVRMAARHRVDAALAALFGTVGWGGVPDGPAAALRAAGRRAVLRTMAQAAATERIAAAFDAAGIRFLVLKGIPLGTALFGSLSVRQSKDVDILVDPGRVDAAAAVLTGLGYAQLDDERALCRTPRQRRTLMRMRSHFSYAAPGGVIVELHWRPAVAELLPFDMDAAWRRRDLVRIGRGEMPILPRAMLFRYLACHGAAHAWFRLKWLLDVAALLNRFEPAEVRDLWRGARRDGLGAVIGSTMLLAHGLLRARLPDDVLAEARRDRAARRLERYALAALVGPQPREDYSLLLLINRIRLRSDAAYRRRIAADALYCPQDWRDYTLPDRLFPLYALIRPFAWLRRRLAS